MRHFSTARLTMFTVLSIALTYLVTAESCNKAQLDQLKPSTSTDTVATAAPITGKEYILVPDAAGHLVVDGSIYKGGDVISLKGNFAAVVFNNLRGSAGSPIIVRNATGTVTTIGSPTWNGGSWATALSFSDCHYVKVGGQSSKSNFVVSGSTQSSRQAYFNVALAKHSDNFEVSNITIQNGGTGLWAKTEVVAGDLTTQYPNSYMENLLIHDVSITGTFNEAMYIGHTATYWDMTTNTPYYGSPSGFVSGQQYAQPIKWRNVKIYNNTVSGSGADGIQTSAIDGLEVYGNEVTNWATKHGSADAGGILIGGRTTNTNVHDNYVHDGWGELCQFYGSGENGATHIIKNNLFRDNQLDGVSLRGTNNAVVQILNNTIARIGGVGIRINGYLGMTAPQIVNSNAIIQPRTTGGTIYPNAYIYLENGGTVTEGTGGYANVKLPTVDSALVDINNYYMPLAGSPLLTIGYKK
ncbi:parallel beta helix pectate lyase-like protein [Chitinophaga polysaccharea]|uniref:Parallel beta helix pectate lyase-like protein n=1 Tax=Chitinophaga polysaccharea TaxID=1293035 RepID=A0A561PWE7_9BACT|nr:parallel beta helix pectate lyase-like protein [Chitinophaga polysaccharea]